MSVNEFFEKVFCINLDSRQDRWQETSKILSDHSIVAERVPSIVGSALKIPGAGGVTGCALTHLFVLKHARQLQLDNFLLLEDDIELAHKFNEKFEQAVKEVPADWDMLYLGGNHMFGPKPLPRISEHVYKCRATVAAHAVAFRYTVYDRLINAVVDMTQPCDVHYARAHAEINAYVIMPHLVGQRPDYSDIQNQQMDYSFLWSTQDAI